MSDIELRAQNAAMDAIPMQGDPNKYRQRVADFKAGFFAAEHAIDSAPETLAGRLIDAWCADKGKQIPWALAVQIVAIVTKQPDDERDRLLHMDDEDGSYGKCGRGTSKQKEGKE